jgi:hypothetical protein
MAWGGDHAESALHRNADASITRADGPFSEHIARGRSGEDSRQEEVLGTLKVGCRSEERQGSMARVVAVRIHHEFPHARTCRGMKNLRCGVG